MSKLIYGSLPLTVTAVLLVGWLRGLLRDVAPFRPSSLLFPGLSLLPGFVGAGLLQLYLRRATLAFEISSAGVTHGAALTPWSRIRGLAVRRADGHLLFSVGRTGFLPDLQMVTDAVPTAAEIEHFIERLRLFLAAQYPSIDVRFHLARQPNSVFAHL